MAESTSERRARPNHGMTGEEFATMLKDPKAREAIRDVIVDLAIRREFAAHSGLNLPGNGRR